jgi:acyl-[acyl-carrier-protein] desaturase
VPWEALDSSIGSEQKAARIEVFCAEELYLPDYSAGGVELTRSMFGAAWFQACWSYEESKHGLVFREYLTRSGLRSEAEMAHFEERVLSKVWRLPFQTRRQMACYGALQEAATFLAYKAQKDRAASEGDKVLEAIFFFLSRDEAAHAGFYCTAVELELDEDRNDTLADLAFVIANFKMPGDGLIPDYQERLRVSILNFLRTRRALTQRKPVRKSSRPKYGTRRSSPPLCIGRQLSHGGRSSRINGYQGGDPGK